MRNHSEYTINHNVKLLSEGGQFHGKFTITDRVMIWDDSDRVPHDDMVVAAIQMGFDIDRDACEQARDVQTAEFLVEYKQSQDDFDARVRAGDPEALEIKAEQDYERRAAFGPGVETVDVFTGKRTRT
jgi:hypothetical protein